MRRDDRPRLRLCPRQQRVQGLVRLVGLVPVVTLLRGGCPRGGRRARGRPVDLLGDGDPLGLAGRPTVGRAPVGRLIVPLAAKAILVRSNAIPRVSVPTGNSSVGEVFPSLRGPFLALALV